GAGIAPGCRTGRDEKTAEERSCRGGSPAACRGDVPTGHLPPQGACPTPRCRPGRAVRFPAEIDLILTEQFRRGSRPLSVEPRSWSAQAIPNGTGRKADDRVSCVYLRGNV